MKRKEIEQLNEKLRQIEDLEHMSKELDNEGKSHWWKVKTPNKEISLHDNGTRRRFKEFINEEIERLKEEILLED